MANLFQSACQEVIDYGLDAWDDGIAERVTTSSTMRSLLWVPYAAAPVALLWICAALAVTHPVVASAAPGSAGGGLQSGTTMNLMTAFLMVFGSAFGVAALLGFFLTWLARRKNPERGRSRWGRWLRATLFLLVLPGRLIAFGAALVVLLVLGNVITAFAIGLVIAFLFLSSQFGFFAHGPVVGAGAAVAIFLVLLVSCFFVVGGKRWSNQYGWGYTGGVSLARYVVPLVTLIGLVPMLLTVVFALFVALIPGFLFLQGLVNLMPQLAPIVQDSGPLLGFGIPLLILLPGAIGDGIAIVRSADDKMTQSRYGPWDLP